MKIYNSNDIKNIFDKHFSLLCPSCATVSNVSAVSFPNYELVRRFKPSSVIVGYRCDSCNSPIALKYGVVNYANKNSIDLSEDYQVIERPLEKFEYEYLPESVAEDFKEAVLCYSQGAFNAFAAMCRRTSQSIFMDLGASAKDRVHYQLREAKELAGLDDEIEEIFNQILVSGHDGAHPHLPLMDQERSEVLFVLMQDILTEIYVRKAKIREAMEARKKAIEAKKEK